MNNLLNELIDRNRELCIEGKLADYIPELQKAKKNALGIYISDINGNEYFAGDYNYKFTIQSISKVVSLLLALRDNNEEYVFSKVGMEPTGDPFNSMIRLETVTPSKPFNPMINAGAIAVTSMIHGKTSEERFERLLDFFKLITGNDDLKINEKVYMSEKETGNRNRAMAYFLKDVGVLQENVEVALDVYFRQCSIEITCKDIAKIGLIIANEGYDIEKKKQLLDPKYVRIAQTLMFTCGMYDASGEFAINVGIPAKSGVGGGIMATLPYKLGIGVVGPSLDKRGNSIAGINVLKEFANYYDIHIL